MSPPESPRGIPEPRLAVLIRSLFVSLCRSTERFAAGETELGTGQVAPCTNNSLALAAGGPRPVAHGAAGLGHQWPELNGRICPPQAHPHPVLSSNTLRPIMGSRVLEPSTREIRGIQFTNEDLTCLLRGRQDRIPGTTLNAFGAWLQDVATLSKHDFCFLSSWVPALVNGEVASGSFYGSIESHVLAAVRLLSVARTWY